MDEARHLGPQEHANGEQQDDARNSEMVRNRLSDHPGSKRDRDGERRVVDEVKVHRGSLVASDPSTPGLCPRWRELADTEGLDRLARLRLQLKRTHVAHGVAWEAALVGRERPTFRINAVLRRNHVDGDAARTKGARLRGAAVVP